MKETSREFTITGCSFVLSDPWNVLSGVNVYIKDGIVMDVGDYQSGDVLDCKGGVLMSGLVNAHTHTPMSILRGYKDDLDLHQWLSSMWEKEASICNDVMNIGSEISILEMLLSGTTAFVDMYFNPSGVKDLAERYHIRAFAGETFMDNREDAESVKRRQESLSSSTFFKPIVNVHSLYTASLETLRKAAQIAESQKTWIHMHLSETRQEVYSIKRKTGKFPVELLNEAGFLNLIQAVHMGWVTNQEISYMKGKTSTHCPVSNMKLATAGSFPFKEMHESGVNVTIGTDGAASNNSLDMFREMKAAVLLQRHSYWDLWVKASHVLEASTLNGYKLIGINGGEIKRGKVADLVILDRRSMLPLKSDRIVSNLVYNVTGNSVNTVIVGGEISYDVSRKETFLNRIETLYNEVKDI
ncbi:amidohydrolase [Sulfuracidifex metallicus]|uniref:amidohydrolase n=1 Tax=Sulfuracidifex metallicus TaxID=47303 RepID=UPI00227568FC|nr:amidohydrolase [Sulfuracidifex metallicus]MCY0850960.1 amidohydrolase [Sulfuracidifex metallicus]